MQYFVGGSNILGDILTDGFWFGAFRLGIFCGWVLTGYHGLLTYLKKKCFFFYHSSLWEDIKNLHFNKSTRGLLQVVLNGGLIEYSYLPE